MGKGCFRVLKTCGTISARALRGRVSRKMTVKNRNRRNRDRVIFQSQENGTPLPATGIGLGLFRRRFRFRVGDDEMRRVGRGLHQLRLIGIDVHRHSDVISVAAM
jgi:hypothetical protein